MAIKPMGKAIIIMVVVASIGTGVMYSGVLNKLPAPTRAEVEETKMIEPAPSMPVNMPEPRVEATVQPSTPPTAEAGTDNGGNDAAFEAVMKAAEAKKGNSK